MACVQQSDAAYNSLSRQGSGSTRRLPLISLLPLLLLGLALLLSGGAAAARPPPQLHHNCPAWLLEYINFHQRMKFHPDAKYLMYDCNSIGCLGLGDRLRGMMWLVRYAAHTKRVFLVRMTVPINIQSYFQPTYIDWRVDAVGPNNQTLSVPTPKELPSWPNDIKNETGLVTIKNATYEALKWIGGRINTPEFHPVPAAYPVAAFSRNGSCILQSLFMPSEEAEFFVSKHYASMQVNPTRPYISIHLRLFQMVGEGEENAHNIRHEERVLVSLMGARDMAPKCGVDLSTNPAVLITDGLHIRRRVSLQLYNQLTTAPIQPHHFDTSGKGEEAYDRHMETIADLIVMARSAGLYYDYRSGFSRMAAYLGGHALSETNVSNPCLVVAGLCDKWHGLLDYRRPVRTNDNRNGLPLPGTI